MTLRNPPSWLQNGSHPAENDRLTAQGLLRTTGILSAQDLFVSQAVVPAMSVIVASGWAAIVGTTQANMGTYQTYNDATLTGIITTADPVNPRIDLICIQVEDAAYTGVPNDVILKIVTGIPNAAPAVPATPTNSIVLAQVAVGAAVTSILNTNITDKRVLCSFGIGSDYAAGKNRILNGDFGIWQRGISMAMGGYTADRWVSNGTGTCTQQTFTPGSAPSLGYEGKFYMNSTLSASSINAEVIHRVEDARTFAGQTVTLSFWARSTVGAQPLNVAVFQNFGTGGSPSSLMQATLVSGSPYPYTPSATWQRYTYTLTMPSVAGKTFGTNNDSFVWLRLAQYTTTATNTSLDLWGAQFELGSVATAFQTATGNPASELAACRRYNTRFGGDSIYQNYGIGVAISATQANINIYLPVSLRVLASSVDFSTLTLGDNVNALVPVTAVIIDQASRDHVSLTITTGGGLTQYRVYKLLANNSLASYLGFNSEL